MELTQQQRSTRLLDDLGFTGDINNLHEVEIFLTNASWQRMEATGLDSWLLLWSKFPRFIYKCERYYEFVGKVCSEYQKLDNQLAIETREWG